MNVISSEKKSFKQQRSKSINELTGKEKKEKFLMGFRHMYRRVCEKKFREDAEGM